MSTEQNPLFKLLNFQFQFHEGERTCEIRCPISPIMLNALGTVHGGIYTYIADTAMGHLALHFKKHPYVSLELKTSFLKTANQGHLTATARFIKEGQRILFLECHVKDETGEIMCMTTSTFYRVEHSVN